MSHLTDMLPVPDRPITCQSSMIWYSDSGTTPAVVEQIATMPGTDGDELWMKVKRYVDGGVVRYLEVLTYFDDETDLEDGIFVDSAITYSGASASTITGLWHLRGQTVKYLADGVAGSGTVSATGNLTLSAAATKVHIGYGYTSKLETLDIEAGAQGGTAQTRSKRISNVYARLHRSQGGKIGTTTLQDSIAYDDALLFTGDKPMAMRSGWGGVSTVYLEHSDPVPFTVLGLVIELNVSG